jgi:hypothetical protein
MSGFIDQCPNTRLRIQAFVADDVTEDAHVYVQVTCIMCRQVHCVNPLTGNVLGASGKAIGATGE